MRTLFVLQAGLLVFSGTSQDGDTSNAYTMRFGGALGLADTYPAKEQLFVTYLDFDEEGFTSDDLWRNAYTKVGYVSSLALAQRVFYSPCPFGEFSLGAWQRNDGPVDGYGLSISRYWGSALYRMRLRSLPFLRPAMGFTIARDHKSQSYRDDFGVGGYFNCTTNSTAVSALIGLRVASKHWIYAVDVEFAAFVDINGTFEDHLSSGSFGHRLGLLEAARQNYMVRPISLWVVYMFGKTKAR